MALCLVLTACEQEAETPYLPPVAFDTARAWIAAPGGDSTALLVEIAETAAQRTFGLMARSSLDAGSGMIFEYGAGQPDSAGFWMFRTRIPLDIAFLDSAGVVRKILEMVPCESEMYASACPIYQPGVPYWSALEVNKGWFAEHGVVEGAVVRVVR